MTKKDYVLIARAFALTADINDTTGYKLARYDVARFLAESLALDNPKFDRSRFLAACGVQS
jgi:hypothetical protein